MKRREFSILMGGTAVASTTWPSLLGAQQKAMPVNDQSDALLVDIDRFFASRPYPIGQPGGATRDPYHLSGRQFTEVVGLMSYGSNLTDAWRQVGAYAGRILKGTKPADLPVAQSSRF